MMRAMNNVFGSRNRDLMNGGLIMSGLAQSQKNNVHPADAKATKNFKKYFITLFLFLTEISITMLAGLLIALWAVPAAHTQRGYISGGGEWILIGAVSVTANMVCNHWLHK